MVHVTDMGNSVNNEYGKGFTSQMWEIVIGGVIASAGIGAGYAVLADRSSIDGFAECWCDVEFIDVSVDDNENDKSVTDAEADIDGSGNGIPVSISNAYPGAESSISFSIIVTTLEV